MHQGGHTFEKALTEDINLIVEFAKGLKYQLQFRDQWMLNALEREGASFLRLAKACMEKESVTVTSVMAVIKLLSTVLLIHSCTAT